jgi:sec-independent protein translocase protein TatC
MSFLDHLEELRSTLLQSILVFFIMSVICWFFSGRILTMVINDLPVDNLVFLSPVGAFMIRLKLSFIMGAMLAFPFVLYKIWSFVSPGLFAAEKKKIMPFLFSSSLLFYVGIVFCYFVVIPVVMPFLLGFATSNLVPMWTASDTLAQVGKLCFGFGIVFQLPIIVLILSLMGLVTPEFLLKQWRYAVLLIFLMSAVLTPPDFLSQTAMALPVVLLYIGSVLIAKKVVRQRKLEEKDNNSD